MISYLNLLMNLIMRNTWKILRCVRLLLLLKKELIKLNKNLIGSKKWQMSGTKQMPQIKLNKLQRLMTQNHINLTVSPISSLIINLESHVSGVSKQSYNKRIAEAKEKEE